MFFREKRDDDRKVYYSSISVVFGQKSVSGETLNISSGGYCFYTLSPIEEDSGVVSVLLKGLGKNDYFFAHGKIVHRSTVNDTYVYGVSFTLMDKHSTEGINDLVSRLKR